MIYILRFIIYFQFKLKTWVEKLQMSYLLYGSITEKYVVARVNLK